MIIITSNVLKVDLSDLEHLGLMNFQLRDVEADGHIRILDPQLPLSERPRKQKEHQVLVRVLEREKSIEEVDLH